MTHRPALILAFAFALGIWSGPFLGPVPGLLLLTGVFAVAVLALRRQERGGMLVLCFLLCGAFAQWNAALLPPDHITHRMDKLGGRDVDVLGRIVSVPVRRSEGVAPKSIFTLELDRAGGLSLKGRVIVNLFGDSDFSCGDRIRVTGKFSPPFDPLSGGRGSYRAYLARQGIHAVLHVRKVSSRILIERAGGWSFGRITITARQALERIFERYLSPGESGLMKAMLLGPREGILAHVNDIFRRTGTAHIIAISGMNMTLTAIGVMLVLGLFNIPRVPRAVLAVLILGFYSCMAGNSAPVARSAVMAAVVILSFVMERETDPLNNLGLAALVLLAADPGQLNDIGFQLSFVCVASLILLVPIILAPFEAAGVKEKPLAWFFIESAGVTLAAFIGSAGILVYDLHYVALIGLLVNLPVIPLMALVTALGAVVLATGLLLPVVAWPFSLCLKLVLNTVAGLLVWAGQAPLLSCENMPLWVVLAYYAGLLIIVIYSRPRPASLIDKPLPL